MRYRLMVVAFALASYVSVVDASVAVYDNEATFLAATGAVSLSIPTSLSVPQCDCIASTCSDAVTIPFGANSLTVTGPYAPSTPCIPGLMHPVCIVPASIPCPETPAYTTQTIVIEGTDDFEFDFSSPVYSIGLDIQPNDVAVEAVTLRDVSGAVIDSVSIDYLTTPFVKAFVGFSSTTPIKSAFLNTANGASVNEGISGILVSDTIVTSTPPRECVRSRPNLISWWPGDGDATDPAAVNSGVLLNGAGFDAGMIGEAFNLDGINDYVEVPDSPTLTPPSITLSAWVNPATVSTGSDGRVILSKYNSNNPGVNGVSWTLLMNNSGTLRFVVYQDTAGTIYRGIDTNGAVLQADVWRHVAATFEVSTQAIGILVDGKAIESSLIAGSSTITSIADSKTPIRMGTAVNGAGQFVSFWSGRIDEAQLYDRALSACEIGAISLARAGLCKRDGDGDGIPDFRDNCPGVMNADQADADGDEFGDVCDCAPADPRVFSSPGDFKAVMVGVDGNPQTVDWCVDALTLGPGSVFDVLRGALNELPVGSGPSEVCVANDLTTPNTVDSSRPAAGKGFWYAVRGINSCGIGTYGFQSNGRERISSACP